MKGRYITIAVVIGTSIAYPANPGGAQRSYAEPGVFGIRMLGQSGTAAPARKRLIRFDDLRSVQFSSDGQMLVLDKEINSLDLYNRSLQYEYSLPPRVARKRLVVPTAFAVSASGVVAVIEITGQAISLYKIHEHAAELFATVEVPGEPTSICAIDGSFFVHIKESRRTIVRLSDTGHLQRGFQLRLPNNISELAAGYYDSRLLCLPANHMLIAYSKDFPEVMSYDTSGQLRWVENLSEFHPLEMKQYPDGTVAVRISGGASQEIITSFPVEPNTIALQFRSLNALEEPSESTVETRFLNVVTGHEVGSTRSLPVIAQAFARAVYVYDPLGGAIKRFPYDVRTR